MPCQSAVAEGYRRIYFDDQQRVCYDVPESVYKLVEAAAARQKMTPGQYLFARGAGAQGMSMKQATRRANAQGMTAGVLLMQLGMAQPIEVVGDF